jgi:hypothetical protein
MHVRLDGSQCLDGCGKSRFPLAFDPRTVQPVASRYTDWAIAAHLISGEAIWSLFLLLSRLFEMHSDQPRNTGYVSLSYRWRVTFSWVCTNVLIHAQWNERIQRPIFMKYCRRATKMLLKTIIILKWLPLASFHTNMVSFRVESRRQLLKLYFSLKCNLILWQCEMLVAW